jgi:predicted RNA-binding Zn-ribbon protein involved in translation (DUF1610 family)
MGKRRFAVFTSSPDTPAPHLLCPNCAGPLTYRETVYGGVKPAERWDYYDCPTCGGFQYRHRTGKITREIVIAKVTTTRKF